VQRSAASNHSRLADATPRVCPGTRPNVSTAQWVNFGLDDRRLGAILGATPHIVSVLLPDINMLNRNFESPGRHIGAILGFIRGKAAGAYGRAPSEVDPPVDEDALTASGIPLPARSFVVLRTLGGLISLLYP
jgi:hypothetical protein